MVKPREPVMPEPVDAFPSPSFPEPDSEILRLIIAYALKAYQAGEVDVAGAVTHAAVHGWYEGGTSKGRTRVRTASIVVNCRSRS